MDRAESYWIKALGTIVPNGYNIRPGGGCHAPVHEETKERIRKSLKGKKIPPEVLAKRTWLKNRTFTPEWKAKISAKAKLRKFRPGELDNFIKAGRIVLNRLEIKARRRGEGNGNSRLTLHGLSLPSGQRPFG